MTDSEKKEPAGHPIGTKVYYAGSRTRTGVVVGGVYRSGVDGGDRQEVRWDSTGKQTSWDPCFLIPEGEEDNLPIIVSGILAYTPGDGRYYEVINDEEE